MLNLQVQFTRRPDGGALLRCVRSDGSTTWQKREGRQGAFFPLHDLTHFAVETILGFRRGFFGLIAEGWAIDETSGKGPRGPLPPEAVLVEHLVGFLDLERATGDAWSAHQYAAQLAIKGIIATDSAPAWLTDAALDRVRVRRRELFAEWAAVPAASALDLTFELPPATA